MTDARSTKLVVATTVSDALRTSKIFDNNLRDQPKVDPSEKP